MMQEQLRHMQDLNVTPMQYNDDLLEVSMHRVLLHKERYLTCNDTASYSLPKKHSQAVLQLSGCLVAEGDDY